MDTRCGTVKYMEDRAVEAIRQGYAGLLITPGEKLSSTGSGKDVCSPNGAATGQCRTLLAVAHGSAVLCDMLGCHEHATGELLVGEELIPLCELHRRAEAERLMPKWRPLPSQSKPKTMSSSELSLSPSLGKPQTR